MKTRTKITVFCLLLGVTGLIGILHTMTPGHMIFYHDTYRRLSYFPIIIGAIVFGFPGGVAFAILSSLSFVPHLLLFFAHGPEAYYSELSEIIFYLAAGVIVGLISSRMNRLSKGYKNLSEQLSESYTRLHDQAVRLVEAEKLLGQSRNLSLLGEVSASLAHEIRNPLAAIKGAAEILADEVKTDHPKYEFVEIMRNEVARLNRSVEDVLANCRGQQVPQTTQQADIGKIVQQVILLLEKQFKEKKIDVRVTAESDFPVFSVDEDRMTQVLINILLNAVDAVSPRGKISLECEQTKQGVQMSVSDDGPGIDEAERERVFHSFVTHKEGGTGLGLAISSKIVKSFGGSMHIDESDLGGARVCMFLPREKNPMQKN